MPMQRPQTRYTRSGDVNIAYQVWGEGPFDIVFVPPFVSHVELLWDVGCWAEFNERLGTIGRVITFDKRGTGLSDPVEGTPILETRVDDLRAVMDAAGAERAALIGLSEGGALATFFAATHPDRAWALVLCGATARFGAAPGYPSRHTQEEFRHVIDEVERLWRAHDLASGTTWMLPGATEDDREALGRVFWLGATPGGAAALLRMNAQIDVCDVLDSVRVPTLVTWFEDDMEILVEGSRYLAERIPGAVRLALPGPGHFPFTSPEAIARIESFLRDGWESRGIAERSAQRVLSTVLFTDIVGSTEHLAQLGDREWRELLDGYRATVRRQLVVHRGTEVDTAGDGFLACFDGPARAIACAEAVMRETAGLGIEIRAGVHTGECERTRERVAGMAVHIGSRITGEAGPGEILVSRTVRDLVLGSGLAFRERGAFKLKGVPGEWELYALESPALVAAS